MCPEVSLFMTFMTKIMAVLDGWISRCVAVCYGGGECCPCKLLIDLGMQRSCILLAGIRLRKIASKSEKTNPIESVDSRLRGNDKNMRRSESPKAPFGGRWGSD